MLAIAFVSRVASIAPARTRSEIALHAVVERFCAKSRSRKRWRGRCAPGQYLQPVPTDPLHFGAQESGPKSRTSGADSKPSPAIWERPTSFHAASREIESSLRLTKAAARRLCAQPTRRLSRPLSPPSLLDIWGQLSTMELEFQFHEHRWLPPVLQKPIQMQHIRINRERNRRVTCASQSPLSRFGARCGVEHRARSLRQRQAFAWSGPTEATPCDRMRRLSGRPWVL